MPDRGRGCGPVSRRARPGAAVAPGSARPERELASAVPSTSDGLPAWRYSSRLNGAFAGKLDLAYKQSDKRRKPIQSLRTRGTPRPVTDCSRGPVPTDIAQCSPSATDNLFAFPVETAPRDGGIRLLRARRTDTLARGETRSRGTARPATARVRRHSGGTGVPEHRIAPRR
jgi:hypothetical protein